MRASAFEYTGPPPLQRILHSASFRNAAASRVRIISPTPQFVDVFPAQRGQFAPDFSDTFFGSAVQVVLDRFGRREGKLL